LWTAEWLAGGASSWSSSTERHFIEGMLPRPIYRWKSFWLGVLVLAFLGWAWLRSYHHFDEGSLALAPGGPSVMVSHDRSRIDIEWRPTYYGNGTYLSFLPVAAGHEWFPSFSYFSRNGAGRTWISFAYWFLILLFLIPWSAYLAWRWRRMKRPA
jgi:hypothetical protein